MKDNKGIYKGKASVPKEKVIEFNLDEFEQRDYEAKKDYFKSYISNNKPIPKSVGKSKVYIDWVAQLKEELQQEQAGLIKFQKEAISKHKELQDASNEITYQADRIHQLDKEMSFYSRCIWNAKNKLEIDPVKAHSEKFKGNSGHGAPKKDRVISLIKKYPDLLTQKSVIYAIQHKYKKVYKQKVGRTTVYEALKEFDLK